MVGQLNACIVGVFFLVSAWTKFRDPLAFVDVAKGYFPRYALRAAAWARWIAPVELLIAASILSLIPWLLAFGLPVAVAFLIGTTALVARRVMRGERTFRCGCGVDLSAAHLGSTLLFRNSVLLALVISALALPRPDLDWTAAASLYLVSAGLYVAWRLLGAFARGLRILSEWKEYGSPLT